MSTKAPTSYPCTSQLSIISCGGWRWREDAAGLDYNLFLRKLKEQKFTPSQMVPLQLRLNMLESFLDFSSRSKDRYYKRPFVLRTGHVDHHRSQLPIHPREGCLCAFQHLSFFVSGRPSRVWENGCARRSAQGTKQFSVCP